jgi:hypothetical protein
MAGTAAAITAAGLPWRSWIGSGSGGESVALPHRTFSARRETDDRGGVEAPLPMDPAPGSRSLAQRSERSAAVLDELMRWCGRLGRTARRMRRRMGQLDGPVPGSSGLCSGGRVAAGGGPSSQSANSSANAAMAALRRSVDIGSSLGWPTVTWGARLPAPRWPGRRCSPPAPTMSLLVVLLGVGCLCEAAWSPSWSGWVSGSTGWRAGSGGASGSGVTGRRRVAVDRCRPAGAGGLGGRPCRAAGRRASAPRRGRGRRGQCRPSRSGTAGRYRLRPAVGCRQAGAGCGV